jgi:hypothetical protein
MPETLTDVLRLLDLTDVGRDAFEGRSGESAHRSTPSCDGDDKP